MVNLNRVCLAAAVLILCMGSASVHAVWPTKANADPATTVGGSVLAKRSDGQQWRYSESPAHVNTWWVASEGAEVAPVKATTRPSWEVTVWRDNRTRTLRVSSAGVAETNRGGAGKSVWVKTPKVAALPLLKPIAIPRSDLTSRRSYAERSRRDYDSVAGLAQECEYISHIRIERVLSLYEEEPLNGKGSVVVYLARVIDWLKDPGRGVPNPPLIKLQWRIDKNSEALSFTPLHVGDELIVCTDRRPRLRLVGGTFRISGLFGEHAVSVPPPFGVIRVSGGYTYPFEGALGDDDPQFIYPQVVPLYRQKGGTLAGFMKWAARVEKTRAEPPASIARDLQIGSR